MKDSVSTKAYNSYSKFVTNTANRLNISETMLHRIVLSYISANTSLLDNCIDSLDDNVNFD